MEIKILPVGQLETNCYIVTNENTKECVVVDPGDESNTIMDYLEEHQLKCRAILLTHGHFDHTGALVQVHDQTGACAYMNERDRVFLGDPFVSGKADEQAAKAFSFLQNYDDGDRLSYAGMDFDIIATPGHTPGGVTIRTGDVLFTGDTLFHGSCGRTDFPGGSLEELMQSLKKICSIPGDCEVYPGHMDPSTLQRERQFNFYCRKAMSN